MTMRLLLPSFVLLLSGMEAGPLVFNTYSFAQAANSGGPASPAETAPGPTSVSSLGGLCLERIGCTSNSGFAAAGIGFLAGSSYASATHERGAPMLHAAASSESRFLDQFILTSTVLPDGSFVDILFSQDVSGSIGHLIGDVGAAEALAISTFGIDFLNQSVFSRCVGGVTFCAGLGDEDTSGTFRARLGQVYSRRARLVTLADATGSSSAFSSYGSTAYYYLDLPEGVEILTASGATYSEVSAIPEPSTTSFVVLGVALFWVSRRRFRIVRQSTD